MEKSDTCAFTVGIGDKVQSQVDLLRRTFKANHPDIPLLHFDLPEFRLLTGQVCPVRLCEIIAFRTIAGWLLSRHFRRVIHLDADIVIFNELTRLIETNAPVLFTHDVPTCDLGPEGAPRINSGVVVATHEGFWEAWTKELYSYLTPLLNTIMDQMALRKMVRDKLIDYEILPEKELHEYYNNASLQVTGRFWVIEGEVYKAKEKLKLFHWAGQKVRDTSVFPEHIRAFIDEMKEPEGTRAKDREILQSIMNKSGKCFRSDLVKFMKSLPFQFYRDKHLANLNPGVWWSWVPMKLDACRRELPDDLQRVIDGKDDVYYYIEKTMNEKQGLGGFQKQGVYLEAAKQQATAI
ncbi:MAG: hypothetical protein AAF984_02070 [Verrucomicrobiota bacterium]